MRGWIGDEGEARVVRDVQPLVAVGRPGVGQLGARQQMPVRGARPRPEPEGAVDVHPGASRVRKLAGLPERVEGAGVQLAGLEADQRRPVRLPVERALELGRG